MGNNLQNKFKLYKISTTLFILYLIMSQTINVTNASSLPQNDQDLVSFACNHTLYIEICMSSLSSDSRAKTVSDLKVIAAIAMDQTITQAAETESYINELLEKSRGSSAEKSGPRSSSLEDCQEEYSEAVEDLREAAEALSHGKYYVVNELVSGAMTDCQTCLDESNERKGGNGDDKNGLNSFVERNEYFYKLCSNVLAILKLFG